LRQIGIAETMYVADYRGSTVPYQFYKDGVSSINVTSNSDYEPWYTALVALHYLPRPSITVASLKPNAVYDYSSVFVCPSTPPAVASAPSSSFPNIKKGS